MNKLFIQYRVRDNLARDNCLQLIKETMHNCISSIHKKSNLFHVSISNYAHDDDKRHPYI
jgi:hypothetical protein